MARQPGSVLRVPNGEINGMFVAFNGLRIFLASVSISTVGSGPTPASRAPMVKLSFDGFGFRFTILGRYLSPMSGSFVVALLLLSIFVLLLLGAIGLSAIVVARV